MVIPQHLSQHDALAGLLPFGYRQIFDISPRITASTAVFPGDTAYERKVVMDCASGDHLTLSSVVTTVHIGAHADAPNHYHRDGVDIARRDLRYYMGACQVVHVRAAAGAYIQPEDLDGVEITAKRVLFHTDSFIDPDRWNDTFNALSPKLIDALAALGVVLVGIDTPSIDVAKSKDLPAHQAVFTHDMAILEGLVLSQIPAGHYGLIALPLNLEGADASPVRAVLLQ